MLTLRIQLIVDAIHKSLLDFVIILIKKFKIPSKVFNNNIEKIQLQGLEDIKSIIIQLTSSNNISIPQTYQTT